MQFQSSKIPRVCIRCATPFLVFPSELKYGKGLFCGNECRIFTERATVPCLRCERPIETNTGRLNTGRGRYCSRACLASRLKPRQPKSPAELLWPRVIKTDTCWLITGARNQYGYGTMAIQKPEGGWRQETTHRVAWWLATGYWPIRPEFVCHDCPGGDDPACVRNDTIGIHVVNGISYEKRGHLWLGTPAANMADLSAKGASLKSRVVRHAG